MESTRDEKALLVFDDVHKADGRIARMLSDLIEEPRKEGRNLRLILLMRHIPRIYDRRSVVSRALVEERRLEGLDEEASLKLLTEKGITGEMARRAFDVSEGMPFYLEVFEEPEEISSHLRAEIFSDLPEGHLRIMKILSTFRIPVERSALAFDATFSEDDLRDLKSRALVKVNDDGRLFLHELISDELYSTLNAVERIGLHDCCTRFLKGWRDGRYYIERIYHLQRSGDHSSAAGLFIENLSESLTSGLVHSMNELIDGFDHRSMKREEWVGLKLAAGEIKFGVGELEMSRGEYEAALNISKELNDRHSTCRALCKLGSLTEGSGTDHDEGLELLKVAQELAFDLDDRDLKIVALHGLCRQCWYLSDHDNVISAGKEALGLMEGPSENPLKGTILLELSIVEWDRDRFKEAMEYSERAGEYLGRAGKPLELARLYQSRGILMMEEGRYEEALALFNKAVELAETTLNFRLTIYTNMNLAHAYALTGRYDKARQTLARVKDRAEKNDMVNILQKIYRTGAMIAEGEGDARRADEMFGRAISLTRERIPGFIHKLAAEYAEMLVRRGENEPALDVLNQALEDTDDDEGEAANKLRRMIDDITGHKTLRAQE